MRHINIEEYIFYTLVIFVFSCKKNEGSSCPTLLKLSTNNSKPIVGDRLTLYAHLGSIIYTWVGHPILLFRKWTVLIVLHLKMYS